MEKAILGSLVGNYEYVSPISCKACTSTFFYCSPTSVPLFSLYAHMYMLWLVFHFLSFLLNSPAMLATFGIFDASNRLQSGE